MLEKLLIAVTLTFSINLFLELAEPTAKQSSLSPHLQQTAERIISLLPYSN